MITGANFKECLKNSDHYELYQAINMPHDFIIMELSIFNAGYIVSYKSTNYSEELQNEANDNGQLFTFKENFLELINESEAFEFSSNDFLVSNAIPLAIIDLGLSTLTIIDCPGYLKNNEKVELFLEEKLGFNMSNCSWGAFDGRINDMRNE